MTTEKTKRDTTTRPATGPRQPMLRGQGATAVGPLDMTMWYAMHHSFRGGLARRDRKAMRHV